MSEAEDERTILDYLNEDCWRAVLQYVPIKDLIKTERASRRWQGVVLTYLKGAGVRITIEEYDSEKKPVCTLKQSSYKSFESWTQKLGFLVEATYCVGLKSLAVIKKNCPNIEALKLKKVQSRTPKLLRRHNLRDNFKSLKRLTFDSCAITDSCVDQFVADKALEGLKFYCSYSLTGAFFKNMNLSNVKYLEIDLCKDFESKHLLPAFDRLSELTKLKLSTISGEFLEGIQVGLDKMPKLEKLYLDDDERMRGECGQQLSRLTRLKHLRLAYQMFDEDIEAITRCCQELVTLDLSDCRSMWRRSVRSIWRNAGARLTALTLGQFDDIKDADIVALIRGCPNLTVLYCSHDTGADMEEQSPHGADARAVRRHKGRRHRGAHPRLSEPHGTVL
ncbi:uncharacterized protein LOC133518438 [Cydia pomonella]|uniref:uncharacterized protein LOC133518438 n=1 Tax=Cydia pomonella TaxID=82600 RepID=UPI002ADD52DA|nr:uncharacterized protein LOC133518438 [Cydia pomonella]